MKCTTRFFQLSAIYIAVSAVMCANAFALEQLDEEELAASTGEGVALLPQDFSMQLNGADVANSGAGSYGAGYVRFIPVGPVTPEADSKGYEKADVWLYGLSLAQSKKNNGATLASSDWGVPFGAIGSGATDFGRPIDSWGAPENPWLFKTLTDTDVPDFNGDIKSVTYLTLEAPLYHETLPVSGSELSSAYNLKLGFWMDLFQRNSDVAETASFNASQLSNRLRLGFNWDSFSVNGSSLKVFQTLGGVSAANSNIGGTYDATLKINNVITTKTFDYGMDTSYNNTLGMSALLRLNSGATDTRRGTVSNQTSNKQIVQMNYNPKTGVYTEGAILVDTTGTVTDAQANDANTTAGITQTYKPMANHYTYSSAVNAYAGDDSTYGTFYSGSFLNGGHCTFGRANNDGSGGNLQFGQCNTREGFTTRRLKATGTNTWTPPAAKSVIRISTREVSGGTYDGSTPALGGNMPSFEQNEGVFLYDPNINLVLGSIYQPLILNADGNNFSFEVTRIPNDPEVYRRIYQNYHDVPDVAGLTLLGSTCNVHSCGTSTVAGYQGNSATHSSISIGATEYDANNNRLYAHKGVGSYGVSFGQLVAGNNISSTNAQDFTQVWRSERPDNTTNRTYASSGCGFAGWGSCSDNFFNAFPNNWTQVAEKSPYVSPTHPSLSRTDPYETTYRQNYNNQILGIQTTKPANIANTLNNMVPTGGTVSNNFGSAVIDGLLIQHFKFTTTGL